MKIALTKLSTKDLATLAQRIISNAQSGKYPVISNHPLVSAIQTSYAAYDEVYTKQIYSGKEQMLLPPIMNVILRTKPQSVSERLPQAFHGG